MPTESSTPVSIPSAQDLEALRREIANVQEERRLLLGRVDSHRATRDEPAHGRLATMASYAFSFVAIVGFVIVVALHPPRVPPVRVLVPAPSAAAVPSPEPTAAVAPDRTAASDVGASPGVGERTGGRRERERGIREATRGGGTRRERDRTPEHLLEGIEEGNDPVGGLAPRGRARSHIDDPIAGID